MKKFVVVLAILSVFGAVLVKGFDKKAAIEDFMGKASVCKAEVGATEGDLAELIAKQPSTTPEGKCLKSCLMKKYEVMDSNGKFVKDVAVKHAENYTDGAADKMKVAIEMIDGCAGLGVSDDPCEAAEQYCKCFKDQATAHGLKDWQF